MDTSTCEGDRHQHIFMENKCNTLRGQIKAYIFDINLCCCAVHVMLLCCICNVMHHHTNITCNVTLTYTHRLQVVKNC